MVSRQCTATAKGTGNRCRRRPIPGGTVCKMHGGGAPQVQRSARQRLLELAEPAVEALRRALEDGDWAATVRAAVAILDRAGCGPSSKIEFENVTERHAQAIAAVVRDALKACGVDPSAPEVASLVRDRLQAEGRGEPWKPRRLGLADWEVLL